MRLKMEGVKQQISKLINKSNNILIATPENINGDALGSVLALKHALKKLGKSVHFVIPKEIPSKFHFLPIEDSLSHETFLEREFVLSIQNPEDHINNICYEKRDGFLHIYLKTKKKIEEQDLRINHSHPFDLIFMVNAQDFEHLGRVFEYNAKLFFETPVINIDNHHANEHFGELNLVDITYSSVSEIVMELIDFIDRNLLDQAISTYILTGLIDATDNFQSSKTNPRTFNNAALLINRGGDQQKIIRYFYKTKSLNFLKLWGKILHTLSWNAKEKFISVKLKPGDFQKTNTDAQHFPRVIEEIKISFPEVETGLLLWQDSPQSKVRGIIFSINSDLIKNLSLRLSGEVKNNNLFFSTNQFFLGEAEKEMLNLMKGRI